MTITPTASDAVLLFLKGLATPVVLYVPDAPALYAELKGVLSTTQSLSPKVIEKKGHGPIGHVCFKDVDLVGVALQTEPPLASLQG
jgi:hypothetical protein